GNQFPRRDDSDMYEFYCSSMLMLLKPWCSLQDLWNHEETWESAFSRFHQSASRKHFRLMSSIQYLHECESAAKVRSLRN
ncbi:hypothetical protein K439DRAFT_1349701, partial [Ramaria rubella]